MATYTRTITGESPTLTSQTIPTNTAFVGPRPWVDVRAAPYNAVGDGVTDDQPAIQNAINAIPSTGGMVVFPNPSVGYLLNSTLTVPVNNLQLMGLGPGAATAAGTPGGVRLLLGGSATSAIFAQNKSGLGVDNFFIDCAYISGASGIKLDGVLFSRMSRIQGDRVMTGGGALLHFLCSSSATQNCGANVVQDVHGLNVACLIAFDGFSSPSRVASNNLIVYARANGLGNQVSKIIDFKKFSDSNVFLAADLGVFFAGSAGVVFNSDTPGSDMEVYQNIFYQLIVDQDVASTDSIVCNRTFPGYPNYARLIAGGNNPTFPSMSATALLGLLPGSNVNGTQRVTLPNNTPVEYFSTANAVRRGMILDSSNLFYVGDTNVRTVLEGSDIQWNKALVALGGGAAPTVGTIGGSGPATAAQNSWLRVLDSTGAAAWIPVWK